MMKILIFLALILVLYYMLRGVFRPSKTQGNTSRRRPRAGSSGSRELVRDPYCQTYTPLDTAVRARIGGGDLFFCSEDCMNRYIQEKKKEASQTG
jgi:YHS domain-containing protein